jgi:hypothetical protein
LNGDVGDLWRASQEHGNWEVIDTTAASAR